MNTPKPFREPRLPGSWGRCREFDNHGKMAAIFSFAFCRLCSGMPAENEGRQEVSKFMLVVDR